MLVGRPSGYERVAGGRFIGHKEEANIPNRLGVHVCPAVQWPPSRNRDSIPAEEPDAVFIKGVGAEHGGCVVLT